MAIGDEMIGREVEYGDRRGKVVATKPATLTNVDTGAERDAVKFLIAPATGAPFWTGAVAPAN